MWNTMLIGGCQIEQRNLKPSNQLLYLHLIIPCLENAVAISKWINSFNLSGVSRLYILEIFIGRVFTVARNLLSAGSTSNAR